MVCVSLGELVVSDNQWPEFDPKVERWHKVKIKIHTPDHFNEMRNWIYDNIDGYAKHVDWRYVTIMEDIYLDCRFRYERDYEWFILRWQ
jgi:hypothetical protein